MSGNIISRVLGATWRVLNYDPTSKNTGEQQSTVRTRSLAVPTRTELSFNRCIVTGPFVRLGALLEGAIFSTLGGKNEAKQSFKRADRLNRDFWGD